MHPLRPLIGIVLLASVFAWQAEAQPKATQTVLPPAFLSVIDANFAAWDADKNGTLDGAELDRLVGDGNVKGAKAAAVAAMKRAMRSKKYECPPWTLETLKKHNVPPRGPDGKALPPDLGSLYRNSFERITKANRTLFENPPKLDSIHQGRLGDCFCLAPLGATRRMY
jgi:hypothetical protein